MEPCYTCLSGKPESAFETIPIKKFTKNPAIYTWKIFFRQYSNGLVMIPTKCNLNKHEVLQNWTTEGCQFTGLRKQSF